MRKYIVLILAIFLSTSTSNAFAIKWKIGDFVDDFGDKTGESYQYISGNGKFTNSASINAKLTYKIISKNKLIRFDLYEYGSHAVSSPIDDYYVTLNYKFKGKIYSTNGEYYSKGTIIFKEQKFVKRIKNGGKFKMVLKFDSYYNNSVYKINITIDK